MKITIEYEMTEEFIIYELCSMIFNGEKINLKNLKSNIETNLEGSGILYYECFDEGQFDDFEKLYKKAETQYRRLFIKK